MYNEIICTVKCTAVHWRKNKSNKEEHQLLSHQEISFVLLWLVFNNLNAAVEALELLHSFLLNLNWSNRRGWFDFRFEPPVHSRRIWWWALTRGDWESSCSHLRTVRETLLFSLLWDKRITFQLKQIGRKKTKQTLEISRKYCISGSRNK